MHADTIYALASGIGRSGVAVIRTSGPGSGPALQALCQKMIPPRSAVRVQIKHPQTGEVLDDGLALWFPAPGSYTGEDVTELQIHGGKAVIDGVLEALSCCDGLRMAEPGEFTKRGFLNGKMDLTAAEGIADLIEAETAAQRRQALRQAGGVLAELYEGWRKSLIASLAHLEATIDFSEEDIPQDLLNNVFATVAGLIGDISSHLSDGHRGERLRDGLQLAIVGPPNAGKSSLLNLLARRDAAIVSSTAGTTRDVIEVHLDLGGYPVTIADTAGLRESSDNIEQEGIRRAISRAELSDLRIVVLDGEVWPEVDDITNHMIVSDSLVVLNKSDVIVGLLPSEYQNHSVFPISAKTGEGIDGLLQRLTEEVAARTEESADPVITRRRHREALENCHQALTRAMLDKSQETELVAEDLRLAARALGRITGRVDVEDLLDVIFSDFCIGK